MRRIFSDANEAEVFYQQKLLGAVDKDDLILKEVTTLRKYMTSGKIAELQAENARLHELAAKLLDELAIAKQPGTEEAVPIHDIARGARTPNQSINLHALRWAYAQGGLAATAKAVLMTFAIHCNECGYSWPGVDRIASTWRMDRDTVRRQIEVLLVRRKIYRTKKRCGSTGQVYRLPKIAYESGGKSTLFENDESEGKAPDKRGISGGESAPNKEYRINEQPNREEINRESTRESDARAREIEGRELSQEEKIPRSTRLYCEEKLLGLLSVIVRPSEIVEHGGMWRKRIRSYRKAITEAIKEYHGLSSEKRSEIKNPAAWMTDRYFTYGGRSIAQDEPIEVPVPKRKSSRAV